MNPAFSVIFFTTASGAGYGVLMLLGSAACFGLLPFDKTLNICAIVAALCLVTGGLMSSTFHLGHPERAWRALSQWQTSWLSREGICAILCYIPALALIYACGFSSDGSKLISLAGSVCALLAFITVFTTAMIYTSLRSIRAWHNRWVPVNYLLFSLATGGLMLNAFFVWFEVRYAPLVVATIGLFMLSLITKMAYWRFLDANPSETTAASAIGVAQTSTVRLSQAPHSQMNYLQQEMGYQVARKHAHKLRQIALITGFVIPAILLATILLQNSIASVAAATTAVLFGAIGILVERWLFFAEARHVVGLYYGADSA